MNRQAARLHRIRVMIFIDDADDLTRSLCERAAVSTTTDVQAEFLRSDGGKSSFLRCPNPRHGDQAALRCIRREESEYFRHPEGIARLLWLCTERGLDDLSVRAPAPRRCPLPSLLLDVRRADQL